MHLTPVQKERLANREKDEYANLKRTNDYLVREALKDFLNLEDVYIILEKLPKAQIERVLTEEHIYSLLDLAIRLLQFLGPGEGSYYEVPLENQPAGEKKKVVVKVSSVDSQRASYLQNVINRLGEQKRKYEDSYNTYANFENMSQKGLKIPYKKTKGKKVDLDLDDMLNALNLDGEPK